MRKHLSWLAWLSFMICGVASVSATQTDTEQTAAAKSWPKPAVLIRQLESLTEVEQVEPWASQTISLIENICDVANGPVAKERILNQLEERLNEAQQIEATVWKRHAAGQVIPERLGEISRIRYRLQRRIAIWKSLLPKLQTARKLGDQGQVRPASTTRITFDDIDPQWTAYLGLDEFQEALGRLNSNRGAQEKAARKVLSRLSSSSLTEPQIDYLQQTISPEVVEFIRQHAASDVQPYEVVKAIERFERRPSKLAGRYLNDVYQGLLWSEAAVNQRLAEQIDTHYRIANVRLAMSERLLNYMIPELPSTAVPVRESFQGAMIRGQSHVSNDLRIRLNEDANQLNFQIETAGQVQSDTIARTKTFRIKNIGQAEFHVLKPITINQNGIHDSVQLSSVATGSQRVVGVSSTLDHLPLVGNVARRLAKRKLQGQAGETNRLFKRKVESSAKLQVEEEVDKLISKIREESYPKLINPLVALELDPKPVQLKTTPERLVIRYRLAGLDQMAASTARPRDLETDLLSFQIHQSALNNPIARLGLNGETFTSDQLTEHLRQTLGLKDIGTQEQASNKKATFEFAKYDPIRVDFADDRIKITLNLQSLKVGDKGKTWKKLSVTSSYKMRTEQMQLTLDQEGTEVNRKRLRIGDRAAIITVMNVIFKGQYTVNLLPKAIAQRINGDNLIVSQLVASDGWFAMAINERTESITKTQTPPPLRIGVLRRLKNR